MPSGVPETYLPLISLPVISTSATFLSVTSFKKVVNGICWGPRLKFAEKFQISTATTTRTIQKSKLLRVEFNLGLLTALLSRISRLVRPL